MNKLLVIPILASIFIIIDLYVYGALKIFFKQKPKVYLKIFSVLYVLITLVSLLGLFTHHFADKSLISDTQRTYLMSFLFVGYFSKGIATLVLMSNDIIGGFQHLIKWLIVKPAISDKSESGKISRGDFIKKTAIITAAIPFSTLSFGLLNGVHNYRVINRRITLPNLPKAFHGIKIAQISDLHSGSFFDKKSVIGGIDMLLDQKPDITFFTGDLVNNETKEVDEYMDVFKRVKAPLGVYSTLGNHDYGNYRVWSGERAKKQNLLDMHQAHDILGWKLLNNTNHILSLSGEKLAIVGVENWGTGRFPKYGQLARAIVGTEGVPVKLLLSHDPSHWDAEVRPVFSDIDVTFSGHTHGFQFGIEIPNVKWSPSQYLYNQWADLYQEGNQYLYVNRGFGFIGFPGRVGIEPEITIIELLKG